MRKEIIIFICLLNRMFILFFSWLRDTARCEKLCWKRGDGLLLHDAMSVLFLWYFYNVTKSNLAQSGLPGFTGIAKGTINAMLSPGQA
jgi:hypothetical protein